MPSLSDFEESVNWNKLVFCSMDYGSSFCMENTRHLQSDKLSFQNTITPLTCLVRYNQNSIWRTKVIHLIISRKKSPLRDVPFAMQYIQDILESEQISYDSIIRVCFYL